MSKSKYGQKLKSSRKVVLTSFLNQNDGYWSLSDFGHLKFYRKTLPKLVNWQFELVLLLLLLISRKINFEYDRPRNFYFPLKLLFDFS